MRKNENLLIVTNAIDIGSKIVLETLGNSASDTVQGVDMRVDVARLIAGKMKARLAHHLTATNNNESVEASNDR